MPQDYDRLLNEAIDADGRGDYAEAFKKFIVCANNGDRLAQYNLAVYLANEGRGVPRDLEAAGELAESAWKLGLDEAKGLYAYILRLRSKEAETQGNNKLANELLCLSAELGNKVAMVKVASRAEDYDKLAELREEAQKSSFYKLAEKLREYNENEKKVAWKPNTDAGSDEA